MAIEVRTFPDGRMDSENTAQYIGCSTKTLANMRSAGIGPAYLKRGRIFYGIILLTYVNGGGG